MLFQWLGFVLATALMALPVGMAFGGSWKQSLAGGTGLGLVLYLLFDKLLDVVLPTGPLAALLGGS
jgi:putative tricarboxylic transport membrane protein